MADFGAVASFGKVADCSTPLIENESMSIVPYITCTSKHAAPEVVLHSIMDTLLASNGNWKM